MTQDLTDSDEFGDCCFGSMADQDSTVRLLSRLESLSGRIKELEAENAKLLSRLSACQCHCLDRKCDFDSVSGNGGISRKLDGFGEKSRNKKFVDKNLPGANTNTMHHCSRRYIALKVMYFGKRFYGFASEAHMDPTVESEIFKALEKTRLLLGSKKDIQYSRCGRTDKGVSSVGQVITLFVRSNLGEFENCNGDKKVISEKEYEGEIDYVKILNRVLPNDVKILGWSPAPVTLNARFGCLSRQYKYFFWRGDLNLNAMEIAANKFVGEHDFRNFCKMDAANVHNFKRIIYSFEISHCITRFTGNELWAMKIKGSAFLWHQVRCMASILFMIGQGLEAPDVVDALLDTEMVPRKPQYILARDNPLILQSCEFENLRFICSTDARKDLTAKMENEFRNYLLEAAIVHEALLVSAYVEDGESRLAYLCGVSRNNGNIKEACHVDLLSRPCEPSYEERRARLKAKALGCRNDASFALGSK